MRKTLCLVLTAVLALCALCAHADGVGQTYKAFEASYAENIVFINENTGRMLLPHNLTKDYDSRARRFYRIQSGALSMEMHMDDSGERIATCLITLTAPAGMTYGDAQYRDFATAGYHSYALIMAMSDAATVADRYGLVEQVNWGIKQYGGAFDTECGDYRLTCKSENGVATMLFENALLVPQTPEPAEPAPEMDIIDEDVPEEEGDSLAG